MRTSNKEPHMDYNQLALDARAAIERLLAR